MLSFLSPATLLTAPGQAGNLEICLVEERGSEGLEHVSQYKVEMTETGRQIKWGVGRRSRMLTDRGDREGKECGEHEEPSRDRYPGNWYEV